MYETKAIVLLGVFLVASALVFAYTPPLRDNIIFNVSTSYTPPSRDNIVFTIGEAAAASDSCTYGGSGTFEIDCSDNCVVDTDYSSATDAIELTGTGNITFASKLDFDIIVVGLNCNLFINNSGEVN